MEKKKRQPSEFDNFRELAKNLIAVPKKEIDKQRTAYDNRKRKKEKPAK
jgi:hypothetical protein